MPRCLRLLSNAFRAPVPVVAARNVNANVNAGVNRLIAQNASSSMGPASTSSLSSFAANPWATSRLSARAWNAEGRVVQGSALPSSTIAPTRSSLLPSSLFSPHSSPSSLLRPSSLLTSSILHHQLQLQPQLSPPSPFAQQLRFKARGTEYQPSQRVRKRRHGFLARKRTASGRNILVRRREKGRRFLSH